MSGPSDVEYSSDGGSLEAIGPYVSDDVSQRYFVFLMLLPRVISAFKQTTSVTSCMTTHRIDQAGRQCDVVCLLELVQKTENEEGVEEVGLR